MGRRGFAPTPTKIKRAQGETRPSQVNYNEPQPRLRLPAKPDDMDDSAKAVWDAVIAEMGPTEVILAADADVLRCYCEAVSRYVRASTMMAKTGLLIQRGGEWVKSPLHQVVRDTADQVRLFARELGLSPSARAGLHIAAASQAAYSIDEELGPPARLRVI